MKARSSKLIPRPQNNNDIIEPIQAQWDSISEHDLGEILNTMIDRVDALDSANGGSTKFQPVFAFFFPLSCYSFFTLVLVTFF